MAAAVWEAAGQVGVVLVLVAPGNRWLVGEAVGSQGSLREGGGREGGREGGWEREEEGRREGGGEKRMEGRRDRGREGGDRGRGREKSWYTCTCACIENCEGWLSPGGHSSGGRALAA